MANTPRSEFGGHEGRSGVIAKPTPRLTPSDKLRLGYTTGVEDPDSPLDRDAWLGNRVGDDE